MDPQPGEWHCRCGKQVCDQLTAAAIGKVSLRCSKCIIIIAQRCSRARPKHIHPEGDDNDDDDDVDAAEEY